MRLPGHDRRCVGMDRQRLHRVPRVCGLPVPGVLGGVLRLAVQGAARRLVANAVAGGRGHVPQLGLPPAAADLLGDADCEGPVSSPPAGSAIQVDSWLSGGDERTLPSDVLDGLTKPFKELPPKHFYDARGSELFEQICEQPEYYPTRTERAILSARADELVADARAGELVELGSGSADKARILLGAMERAGTLRRYVPFDVSESAVQEAACQLVEEYDNLLVHGV